MNPYLLPKHEVEPSAPLNPHLNPDDANFYVPVGNSEKQFFRFQSAMRDSRLLRSHGRLVVVTGLRGCGKTSLVNRCAAWLRDQLRAANMEPLIFDTRNSCSLTHTISTRIQLVLHDIIDDLRFDFSDLRIRDFVERDFTRAYRFISDVIPEEQIVIVLLPPSADLLVEIEQYAAISRYPRLVFFAETEYSEIIQRTPLPDTSIVLEVCPLNVDDGWLFVQSRQSRIPPNQPPIPRVNHSTIRAMLDGRAMSIGLLQEILYGVYQELTKESGQTTDEITFDDLARYYFRASL